MTYTPTKEELEELGFEKSGFTNFFVKKIRFGMTIFYSDNQFHFSGHEVKFQSLEDIKNLIRILTPQ